MSDVNNVYRRTEHNSGLRHRNNIKPDSGMDQTQFSEEWISAPGRDDNALKAMMSETIPKYNKQVEAIQAKFTEYNKQLTAMLALSSEEAKVFKQLESIHQDIQAGNGSPALYDDYTRLTKAALKIVSPETFQAYEKYGVEFVVNPDPKAKYHSCKEIAQGHWQLQLPTSYPYKMAGIVLRTIDIALDLEEKQHGVLPSPGRRAVVMARSLQANEIMGETYGWGIENYDLAKQHHDTSINGLRQAFRKGWITTDTPKEEVRAVSYNNSLEKLLKLIRPTNGREDRDVVKIFPSMQAGAYFEYTNIKEARNGRMPVKMGTKEHDELMKQMELRRQKGENYTVTSVILANEEVWEQPYYVTPDLRSRHPINAKGNNCIWAGERDAIHKKIERIKDQSGHFRTYDRHLKNAMGEDVISRMALSIFKEKGYDISETIVELTADVGSRDLEYFLQPQNEQV